MPQLTLEVPEALTERLARQAALENKPIEQVVVEHLRSLFDATAPGSDTQYKEFCNESDCFVRISEEERNRYQPVSEQRLRELAAKLGAAGSMSQVIIEERGSA